MRLVHLTAVGAKVPSTTLEFARHLTVIYGASEAGKSYVAEAIDYVFGASKLRNVPEANGYQQMLLAVDFDGDVVTFARSLRGGKVSVFDGDIRHVPDHPPDRILAAGHEKGNVDSVSHFLLERLGIAGTKLRKNKRNETVEASFRNLAHLVIIGEERMHSRVSPIESGNYTTRTSELSAFKLLLENDDDSGLHAGEDPTAFRRLNKAQLSVLDRAISASSAPLRNAPDRSDCATMLAKVVSTIQQSAGEISTLLQQREDEVSSLKALTNERQRIEVRASEAGLLSARFTLLDEQYQADLGRLDMVKSAGSLLGYFDSEQCVFCGATADHQHREHAIYETVRLTEAIDAEVARTLALRHDLSSTLQSLADAQHAAAEGLHWLEQNILRVTKTVAEIELRLTPAQDSLNARMVRKSELERWITLWDQVGQLSALSTAVAQEEPARAEAISEGIGKRTELEFSERLRAVLLAWNVPAADRAEFIIGTPPDVILQGRPRADRGKGIRSVLHAGFSTALGEFCLEKDLPHPGFLVLDTPVLTYRDPDGKRQPNDDRPNDGPSELLNTDTSSGADEFVTQTVAESFYTYLAHSQLQTIVLENQTPPVVTADGCKVVYFTGSGGEGRTGFYPG